jgi:hypothetical protein
MVIKVSPKRILSYTNAFDEGDDALTDSIIITKCNFYNKTKVLKLILLINFKQNIYFVLQFIEFYLFKFFLKCKNI